MNYRTHLKAFFAFFLLITVFSVQSFSYEIEEDTGSLMLTEVDFHKAVSENQYLLVNFHALWCRYSKELKPEWKALSHTLKATNSPVKLAKVEAYDEKKIAEEFEIEGYPMIKLFINGVPHEYNGERNQSQILEFLDRKLKKDFTQVNDMETIERSLKDYEWVGVLISDTDNDVVKDIAFDMQEIYFVRIAVSAGGKTSLPKGNFVLVNNITEKKDAFDKQLTKDDLTKFINDSKFGAIPRFSKGTAERIFLNEDPAIILIRHMNGQNDLSADSALTSAQDNIKKANNKMLLSVAIYEEEISKLLADNIGITQEDLPAVVIVRADREKIRKYKLEGSITADSIAKFVNNFEEKKAKRIYISEPLNGIDEENKKNHVKKVVTKNFKELVLDQNKDVLLLVWAPWSNHCRSMMFVYDNVARKTREVENFVVAKIDGSANDLEGFGLDIVEYPTILLFTTTDKENPIEFRGERNEYVFNDFIRSHASVNLTDMKGPNPFDVNEL